jgi:hypothetical protein
MGDEARYMIYGEGSIDSTTEDDVNWDMEDHEYESHYKATLENSSELKASLQNHLYRISYRTSHISSLYKTLKILSNQPHFPKPSPSPSANPKAKSIICQNTPTRKLLGILTPPSPFPTNLTQVLPHCPTCPAPLL